MLRDDETSFAAPEVSGLAVLLVSQRGHGKGRQVRTAIENSTDDLGKPGVDPFTARDASTSPEGFASKVGRRAWTQSVQGAVATWSVISMRYFLMIADSQH